MDNILPAKAVDYYSKHKMTLLTDLVKLKQFLNSEQIQTCQQAQKAKTLSKDLWLIERRYKKLFDAVIEANQKLIYKYIDRTFGTNAGLAGVQEEKMIPHSKCSYDDLFVCLQQSLIETLMTYDPSKGSFSTWAYVYFQKYQREPFYENGQTIRLPPYQYDNIRLLKAKVAELMQKNADQNTGLSQSQIYQLALDSVVATDKGKQTLVQALQTLKIVSFDHIFSTSQANKYEKGLDAIQVQEEVIDTSWLQIERQELKELLYQALDTLSPRERDVIMFRYRLKEPKEGSDDLSKKEELLPLLEIAEIFNVTSERIRQYEAKALRKLGRRDISCNFKDYYQSPPGERVNI